MDKSIHGDSPAAREKRKVLALLMLSIVASRGSIASGHLWAEIQDKVPHLMDHEMLVSILVSAKWVTRTGHTIVATQDGKTLGGKITAALAT